MKEAVVRAASSGKPINDLMSVARSEIGMNSVRKLATTEAKKAKFEFLRNGCMHGQFKHVIVSTQSTYRSFLATLAPHDLHDGWEQAHSTDDSRSIILSSHAVRPQPSDDLKSNVTSN